MPLPTGTRFPIQVISSIKPINNGQFPVVEDVDISGGYQVRADLPDRDAIPAANRKEGMLVFVQSNSNFYTLVGGITNSDWAIANLGGGTGGSNVFVFRPGLPTSAPFYNTWTETVVARDLATTGPAIIMVDGYYAGPFGPVADLDYDLAGRTAIIGYGGPPDSADPTSVVQTLTLATDIQLAHPVYFENIVIQGTIGSASAQIVSEDGPFNFEARNTTFTFQGDIGSAPLIEGFTDGYAKIILSGTSKFAFGGVPPTFNMTGDTHIILHDSARINDFVMSSSGSFTLTVDIFGPAAYFKSSTHSGVTSIITNGGNIYSNFASATIGHVLTKADDGYAIFLPPTSFVGSADYVGSSIGQQRVQAVTISPGWTTVGGFRFLSFRISAFNPARLELVLAPSTIALTCNIRLVDSLTLTPVPGSTVNLPAGSINDQWVGSGDLLDDLVDDTLYQIQVECTGGALTTDFVTVRGGSLVVN